MRLPKSSRGRVSRAVSLPVSVVAVSLTAAALSGCAGTPAVTAPSVVDVGAYRLGVGDGLRVIVYGEDKLSGEYRVSDSGTVTLPLVGAVKASGLSIDQLGEQIAAAYRAGGFLTAPRVAAEVLSYRPFFILGEVNKPGQYPFIPGMTVRQAIATANGYTYRARESEVKVTHWGKTEEETYRLDAGAVVAPGDTIRVPERHF